MVCLNFIREQALFPSTGAGVHRRNKVKSIFETSSSTIVGTRTGIQLSGVSLLRRTIGVLLNTYALTLFSGSHGRVGPENAGDVSYDKQQA